MPVSVGSRLGHYEILSPIGAGGMGEVYRARDSKLGRDVAIKVLPDVFARDPERLARFQREAKLLASLNHANIASIYGLEDSGNSHALVMELAEGRTLADRLRSGPVPVEEALPIAGQIADALEYAHERGVVHRDLKPANIKIAPDDAVKILDFGLAKAVQGEAGAADIANSPTISQMATETGVLLGTAAYMSPEQAKGKPVDRRADIWAFGCVLYEMLTGKKAFEGETTGDVLAAVMRAEPDWKLLPAAAPMRVRVLLRRCLQKDPKQRLRDIGDARISLDEVLSGALGLESGVADTALPTWRKAWQWTAGFLAGAIIVGTLVWSLRPSAVPPRPVTRFTINLPAGQHLAGLDQLALALSPDGTQLAYVAASGDGTKGQAGGQQIYLLPMDTAQARPIPGTGGGTDPFFSPDGRWLGFLVRGSLEKIPTTGGVAQVLFPSFSAFNGATWGTQGKIAFAGILSVVQEVSDGGGAPQPITALQGESGHYWPQYLPGSSAVLFLTASVPQNIGLQQIGSGKPRARLLQIQGGTTPRYVAPGWLTYVQNGTLMAAPFNLKSLRVTAEPTAVLPGILQGAQLFSPAQYVVSSAGSLAYVGTTAHATPQRQLVWVGRDGAERALSIPVGDYDQPRISPDGRRIALDVTDSSGTQQIAIYDVAHNTLSRLTFGGSVNMYPEWTPDAKRVAFMSNREGALNLFWQVSDGSGGAERLEAGKTTVPFSWSLDGKLLAEVQVVPPGSPEIMILNLSDRKSQPFLSNHTGSFEDAPQFSPDGRWIAYASDESGRREIYVQPYPGPGGKWQISVGGGNEPKWNPNGREIFYRTGRKMMAVAVNTQSGFSAANPRQLFEGNYLENPQGYARANYDISPDGQRFLMVKSVDQEAPAPTQINVVLNWTEELKRLVPTGNK